MKNFENITLAQPFTIDIVRDRTKAKKNINKNTLIQFSSKSAMAKTDKSVDTNNRNNISDDDLLDMKPEDYFKNWSKTIRQKCEKDWESNVKNAKTPEEKAKQQKIYNSRMEYKKAVLEYKKALLGELSFDSIDKKNNYYKKLKEARDNVKADNGMTMKEAEAIINGIYSKYRNQHMQIDQMFMEGMNHFEAGPNGTKGHWVPKTKEEKQNAYGMSTEDRTRLQEARTAIAQIEAIYKSYEGTSVFLEVKA